MTDHPAENDRITATATPAAGTRLHVVGSCGVRIVRHELPAPIGACPFSGNPIGGSVSVTYRPAAVVVEVVSLHDALRWACSGQPGAPRSVEALAFWLCDQVHRACGVRVRVRLNLSVNPGPQRLVVDAVLPWHA